MSTPFTWLPFCILLFLETSIDLFSISYRLLSAPVQTSYTIWKSRRGDQIPPRSNHYLWSWSPHTVPVTAWPCNYWSSTLSAVGRGGGSARGNHIQLWSPRFLSSWTAQFAHQNRKHSSCSFWEVGQVGGSLKSELFMSLVCLKARMQSCCTEKWEEVLDVFGKLRVLAPFATSSRHLTSAKS